MPGSPFLKRSTQRCIVAGFTAFIVAACGCSSSTGRVGVSGKVTFKNGESIKRGSIEFTSLDASGFRGGARIADGLYFIPREKGLKPGQYLVRIHAPSALLSGNGGPGGVGKLPEETVSAKYNANSQLTMDVGLTRKQEFNFEVENVMP